MTNWTLVHSSNANTKNVYVCRHARCLYAVYLTHSILRNSDESNINLETIENTLNAALKRRGQR